MDKPVISNRKKYKIFVGIDISKDKLDFAVLMGGQRLLHRVTENDPNAICHFLEELEAIPAFKFSTALFTMEHTGYYGSHLIEVLHKSKANIIVGNAVHIKNSLGLLRGKNDKVDSIRIARYAQRFYQELKLWEPKRQVMLQLANLFSIRNRMLGISVALKTPLKEEKKFIKKGMQQQNTQLCSKSLASIKTDLDQIDLKIAAVVDADADLKMLMEIICSVPSIGPVTAVQMIICTNEFRDIVDPKKFACYAGIAPFTNESGKFVRRAKVSHVANKKMKSLLHICAMGALRYDKEIQAYYDRKKNAEGKNGMVVINAIRYKLVQRVFACVKQRRMFVKEYQRENLKVVKPVGSLETLAS